MTRSAAASVSEASSHFTTGSYVRRVGDRNEPDPENGSRATRSAHVGSEREILEHAVHTITEQAAKADDLVDEAIGVGHGRSDPLVTHAKMLRLELLKVKADLERELEDFSLNCSKCGLDVHWVSGLGVSPGHWAHGEPAPHGEPAVS